LNLGDLPRYADLPVVPGLPARHAWDAWGRDDRVGTLNLLTPERVRYAAGLVRRGAVFPLNWDLELPDPPMFGRQRIRHFSTASSTGTDDWYDGFHPQISSQWDALSHIGHPDAGFYSGLPLSAVATPEVNQLGIEWWARRGIAGRFVLLDLGRRRDAAGRPFDMLSDQAVDTAELEQTAAEQGVELMPGDILLLRFGWIRWYRSAPQEVRDGVPTMGDTATPGIAQTEEMAAWLWDHRIAAVVADNPGVERYPSPPTDFVRFLHFRLITFLGMALGELFDLDGLADDCAHDGVYEGLFTAAPLNKRGGSGSTANALALK
jgi:kynurenine formamidase